MHDQPLRHVAGTRVQFLSEVPASAFRAPRDVVRINASSSYTDALRVLSENHVSSAPVFSDDLSAVRAWTSCAELLEATCGAPLSVGVLW